MMLKTENDEKTSNACTVKLTYNDHGYNELMVIANNLVWFWMFYQCKLRHFTFVMNMHVFILKAPKKCRFCLSFVSKTSFAYKTYQLYATGKFQRKSSPHKRVSKSWRLRNTDLEYHEIIFLLNWFPIDRGIEIAYG